MNLRSAGLLIGTNLITAIVCWNLKVSDSETSAQSTDGPEPSRTSHESQARSAPESSRSADTLREKRQPPSKPYIGNNGSLSSEAIKDYDLSLEQYQRLQQAISGYWATMARKTAERISFDEAASKGAPDDADVYRLPALDKDERLAHEKELENSLRAIGGDVVASDLAQSLTSGAAFGGFGKYDVVFRFRPSVVKQFDTSGNLIGSYLDKSNLMVGYNFIDPKSGEEVLSGNSTSRDLTAEYGNVFAPPGE